MPTYQYRCKNCDQITEAVQKFSDPALTTCPECSGELRKVFNAVGIVFKGSGFYATDSRSGGAKTAATPAPAKTESSKADSTPARTSSSSSTTTSSTASVSKTDAS